MVNVFSKFALGTVCLQNSAFGMFPSTHGRYNYRNNEYQTALQNPEAWARPVANNSRPGPQIFSDENVPDWFTCPVSATPYTASGPNQPICTPDGNTMSAEALWRWNENQLRGNHKPTLPTDPSCVTHSNFLGGKPSYINRALIEAAESVKEAQQQAHQARGGLALSEAREREVESRMAERFEAESSRLRQELNRRDDEAQQLRIREAQLRADIEDLRQCVDGQGPLQNEVDTLRTEHRDCALQLRQREMELNDTRREAHNAQTVAHRLSAESERLRDQNATAWGAISVVRDELSAAAREHHDQLSHFRTEMVEQQQRNNEGLFDAQRSLREAQRTVVQRDTELSRAWTEVDRLQSVNGEREIATLRAEMNAKESEVRAVRAEVQEKDILLQNKTSIVENVSGVLTDLEVKLANVESLGHEATRKLGLADRALTERTDVLNTIKSELESERSGRMSSLKMLDNKENESRRMKSELVDAENVINAKNSSENRLRSELDEQKIVEGQLRLQMEEEKQRMKREEAALKRRVAEMEKKLRMSVPVQVTDLSGGRSRSSSAVWQSGPPISLEIPSPVDMESPLPSTSSRVTVRTKRAFLQAVPGHQNEPPLQAPRGEVPRSPFALNDDFTPATSAPSTRAPSVSPLIGSPVDLSSDAATPATSSAPSRAVSVSCDDNPARARSALRGTPSSSRTQTPDEDSSRADSVERAFLGPRLKWRAPATTSSDLATEENPLSCSTVFENEAKVTSALNSASSSSQVTTSASSNPLRAFASSTSSAAPRSFAPPARAVKGSASTTTIRAPLRPVLGSSSSASQMHRAQSPEQPRPQRLRPSSTVAGSGRARATSTGAVTGSGIQSSTPITPETSTRFGEAPRRHSAGSNARPRAEGSHWRW